MIELMLSFLFDFDAALIATNCAMMLVLPSNFNRVFIQEEQDVSQKRALVDFGGCFLQGDVI
jgi:hypothetical protein